MAALLQDRGGIIMTWWMVLAWAIGGGMAVSLIGFTALSSKPRIERPDTFSDPVYVAKFVGHPVIGGFLALALFNVTPCVVNEVSAAIVGAAGKQIVEAILRSTIGLQMFLVGAQPRDDVEGG
jgi:hypothetical protein